MLPGPLKLLKKDVLCHFLTAARTVIPRHWKLTSMPSLGYWAVEVDKINNLELLLSQESGKEEQFSNTWTLWSMFWYSTGLISWAEGDSTTSTG